MTLRPIPSASALVALAGLALAAPFARAEQSTTPVPAPGAFLPGGANAWRLTWSDEFDYPEARFDERWESQNQANDHILSSRWRENVEVRDGVLRLVARKESRGGQDWTAGSVWTKRQFQYGYFEARYRYAPSTGTNNSFWLMTPPSGPHPAKGKRFEIDINEGHYPNEINTNIHNWSDIRTLPDGRKTHPYASRSYAFGLRPDVTVQLEIPVKTRRIRFSSQHSPQFNLGEFRVYNVNAAGYPDALSPTADTDKPGLVNFARDPSTRITASGFFDRPANTTANLVDGVIDSRWTSQREGEKWVELEFAEERLVGCVQFLNGWSEYNNWKGMVDDYRVSYHDGEKWVDMATFDSKDGAYNFGRDFHVYGLEWSEKEIVFYFNGRELRREKNEFAYSPSPVLLSLALIRWAGPVTEAVHNKAMEIDYVRIYERR